MALDDLITSSDVEEEKRTLYISGKRYGISFEPIVWRTIEDIAAAERLTIGEFFSRINDQIRNHTVVHISNATLIYITRYLREKAGMDEFTMAAPDPHMEDHIHHLDDETGSAPETESETEIDTEKDDDDLASDL